MISKEEQAAELRRLAETKVPAERSDTREILSLETARKQEHELKVHQVELEMQNEELRRTQKELEAAKARYFDLYDLAPVGYCTVIKEGLILEANLTAAILLGEGHRDAMVHRPFTQFILKDDQDIYYHHRKLLFETGDPQTCELRMVKGDGEVFWAHLRAILAVNPDGSPVCRVVISNITQEKQAEELRYASR